jgi:hypothetical protein
MFENESFFHTATTLRALIRRVHERPSIRHTPECQVEWPGCFPSNCRFPDRIVPDSTLLFHDLSGVGNVVRLLMLGQDGGRSGCIQVTGTAALNPD